MYCDKYKSTSISPLPRILNPNAGSELCNNKAKRDRQPLRSMEAHEPKVMTCLFFTMQPHQIEKEVQASEHKKPQIR